MPAACRCVHTQPVRHRAVSGLPLPSLLRQPLRLSTSQADTSWAASWDLGGGGTARHWPGHAREEAIRPRETTLEPREQDVASRGTGLASGRPPKSLCPPLLTCSARTRTKRACAGDADPAGFAVKSKKWSQLPPFAVQVCPRFPSVWWTLLDSGRGGRSSPKLCSRVSAGALFGDQNHSQIHASSEVHPTAF